MNNFYFYEGSEAEFVFVEAKSFYEADQKAHSNIPLKSPVVRKFSANQFANLASETLSTVFVPGITNTAVYFKTGIIIYGKIESREKLLEMLEG